MTTSRRRWGWRLLLSCSIIGGAIASSIVSSNAQIAPDATLGRESSLVTSPNLGSFQIDGGATRGRNLFQSFREFSVPTGGSAYFNNAPSIENILTRVTGPSISNIDGLIRANGTANLFLLNPNGIIFGSNARLNIGGSFFASTASSLKFPGGSEFSATNPQAPPLLTISVPIGLQYGNNPGSIQVQGSSLAVQPGKTLALVGGDVRLDGGKVFAPGGRVELGGVAGTGTIGLNVNGDNLSLSFPARVQRADVSLTNGALINTTGTRSGDIQLSGKRVTLTNQSQILAENRGSQKGGDVSIQAEQINIENGSTVFVRTFGPGRGGNVNIDTKELTLQNQAIVGTSTVSDFGEAQGGDLTVNASEFVELIGNQPGAVTPTPNLAIEFAKKALAQQVTGLGTTALGKGDAGNLTINTERLIARDGAGAVTAVLGTGNGRVLTVNASQSVELTGAAALAATTLNAGNAGSLTVHTGQLTVQDGAVLAVDTLNIPKDGNAGSLTIDTQQLTVRNGSRVGAGTFGSGNGGSVTIKASDSIEVAGTSANSQSAASRPSTINTASAGVGNAGDLTIDTKRLMVRDGAVLTTSTLGAGPGGNFSITATDSVTLTGTSADGQIPSALFADTTGTLGDKKAGDLTINTRRLIVQNGAVASVSTFGSGPGGNLSVKASESIELSGTAPNGLASGLYAQGFAAGNAGNITLTTGRLSVQNSAKVTVAAGNAADAKVFYIPSFLRDFGIQIPPPNAATGQAGNLTIQANSVHLNRGTLLAQTAKSSPEGGANITLSGLDLLRMDNESLISANAFNQANGGNITIDSTFIVATPPTGLKGSDITANAGQGNGGAVNITTQGLFGIQFRPRLTPKNDITVSSDFGLSGTFQLNTPGIDPSQGLANLPTEVVDASHQIVQTCRTGAAAANQQNSFTIIGRGGLPPNPREPLSKDAIQVGWVTLPPERENRSSSAVSPKANLTTPTPLVEAQGWVINDRGKVELIATTPTVTPRSSWHRPVTCPHS